MGHAKPMDELFVEAGELVCRLVPDVRPKPPILVICGDSDAGRSTITAALTGLAVQVPAKYPFMVRIDYRRNHSIEGVVVSTTIVPAPGRNQEEKARLVDNWRYGGPAPLATLPQAIAEAAARIAQVAADAEDVSRSPLMDDVRINVSGPKVPRFSIVDLPYIDQLDRIVVLDDPVIMVPVISLRKPLSSQRAMAAVQKLDPQGRRTLAILGHADAAGIPPNVLLSWNQTTAPFHLLVNRPRDRPQDHPLHDAAEDAFFTLTTPEARRWANVPTDKRGIRALRKRLGAMLGVRTTEDASLMLSRCELAIGDLSKCVLNLDVSKPVLSKRRQLAEMASRFEELMTAAVKGDYEDVAFFDASANESANPESLLDRRIGTAVNGRISSFGERMRVHGRTKTIIDRGEPQGPSEITREDYVAEAKDMIRKRHGWELAGLFNPAAVYDLFNQQSRAWKNIAENAMGDIVAMVRDTAADMVRHLEGAKATPEIEHFVAGRIAALERDLVKEIDGLLRPRCNERALSALTERVSAAHTERQEKEIKRAIIASFGSKILSEKSFNHPGINYEMTITYPIMTDFQARLEQKVCCDLETTAASAAIDYSEEYYKVALDRFIDQVADFALDRCFLSKLPTIFTPLVVSELGDDVIDELLSTSDAQRAELASDLAVLQQARDDLVTVVRTRGLGGDIYKLVDPNLLLKLSTPPPLQSPIKAPKNTSRNSITLGETLAVSSPSPRVSLAPGTDLATLAGLGPLNSPTTPNNAWQDTSLENQPPHQDYPSSSESEDEADEDENTNWAPGTEVPREVPLPFLVATDRDEENKTPAPAPVNRFDFSGTGLNHNSSALFSPVSTTPSIFPAPGYSPVPMSPSPDPRTFPVAANMTWPHAAAAAPTPDEDAGWETVVRSRPLPTWPNNVLANNNHSHAHNNYGGGNINGNKPTGNNAATTDSTKKSRPTKKQDEAARGGKKGEQSSSSPHHSSVSLKDSQSSISSASYQTAQSLLSPLATKSSGSGRKSNRAVAEAPPPRILPSIYGITADPDLLSKGTLGAAATQWYYERDASGLVTAYVHISSTPRFAHYSADELRLLDYALGYWKHGRKVDDSMALSATSPAQRYREVEPQSGEAVFESIVCLPRYQALSVEELRLRDYQLLGRVEKSVIETAVDLFVAANKDANKEGEGGKVVRDSVAIFGPVDVAGLVKEVKKVKEEDGNEQTGIFMRWGSRRSRKGR